MLEAEEEKKCFPPTLSLQLVPAWWQDGRVQFHPAGEECEEYEETSSPEGSSWSSVWTELNIVSQTARTAGPQLDHSWTTEPPELREIFLHFFFLFNVWESESLLGVVTTVTFRGLVDGNISPILASRCSVIRQWHYSVLSTPHHESYYPGPGPLPGPAAAPHHHHRSHRGWHRQVRDQFTESEVENEITPCVVPGNYAMQQAITQLDEVWCDYKHDQAATK